MPDDDWGTEGRPKPLYDPKIVAKWPMWLKGFVLALIVFGGVILTVQQIEKYRQERNLRELSRTPTPTPPPRVIATNTNPCQNIDRSLPDFSELPCNDYPTPYDPNATPPERRQVTLPTDFTRATGYAGAEFLLYKIVEVPGQPGKMMPRQVGHVTFDETDSTKNFADLRILDYSSAYTEGYTHFRGTYDSRKVSAQEYASGANRREVFGLVGLFNIEHTRMNFTLYYLDNNDWQPEGDYEAVWREVNEYPVEYIANTGYWDGRFVRDAYLFRNDKSKWETLSDGSRRYFTVYTVCRAPERLDPDQTRIGGPYRTRREVCTDVRSMGLQNSSENPQSFWFCDVGHSIDCSKMDQ